MEQKVHDMPTVFHTPNQKSRQMILIQKNPAEVKEAIVLKIV
jgi:ribosomal protein L24E